MSYEAIVSNFGEWYNLFKIQDPYRESGMMGASVCETLSNEGIRRFLCQTLGKISRQGKFRNVVIPCDVFNCYWAGEGEKNLPGRTTLTE